MRNFPIFVYDIRAHIQLPKTFDFANSNILEIWNFIIKNMKVLSDYLKILYANGCQYIIKM